MTNPSFRRRRRAVEERAMEIANLHETLLALKRDLLAFERDLDRTTREGDLHGHRRRYLKKRLEVLKARLRLPPTAWTMKHDKVDEPDKPTA